MIINTKYVKRGLQMLRKAFLIVAITVLMGLGLTGCKKSTDESDTAKPQEVKTAQDYGIEAEKDITKENMDEELDKLEKEIEKDIQVEP
jgi:hypothetical protein